MIFCIFVIRVIVKHICITIYEYSLLVSILLLHSLMIGKTVSSIQGSMDLGTRLTGGLCTRTSIKQTPLSSGH